MDSCDVVSHTVFPSTKRREAVSLRVETYRTEVASLMAHVITFARRSTKRYLLAAFADASFSPRRVTSHSPTSWAPSCHENITKELTALPPSAMNSRWWIHQCEGFLVKSWRIHLVAPQYLPEYVDLEGKVRHTLVAKSKLPLHNELRSVLKSHLLAARASHQRRWQTSFCGTAASSGGEMSKDILPFPLSPCPTAAELSLSLEAGRAQLDQDEGPDRHLTSTLTKPAWKHGHS